MLEIRPSVGQMNLSANQIASVSRARASPTAYASRLILSSTSGGGETYCSGRPSMRWMMKLRFCGETERMISCPSA
jgi:hypothetical protein